MKLKLLALSCLICASAAASEIPEPVLPAGVGVNIHFTIGHGHDLDLIAAAGFKWVRMDFVWAAIEQKKGEYDWQAYDGLTADLEKRGLGALYILDYSNPLYEEQVEARDGVTRAAQRDTASPQHPESIAAFARWAAAAARHFHGRHIIWEIWNEPNGSFWKPRPDAAQYSALALATGKAVREAEPDATLIGAATSGFDWPFQETFLKSGALQYLDAVSVHPYRNYNQPPETAAADYRKLRALIEKYGRDNREKRLPILSGEWGYSSRTGGVSLETQAAWIARQQLANLLNGVPLSIWYDWKNDGTEPKDGEQNFGTVMDDLRPKPAYAAIRTLTTALRGYRIVERMDTGNDDFILYCSDASGNLKLAAWTLKEPHSVTVHFPPESLEMRPRASNPKTASGVNGDGSDYSAKLENGRLTLDLGPLPKYITLK